MSLINQPKPYRIFGEHHDLTRQQVDEFFRAADNHRTKLLGLTHGFQSAHITEAGTVLKTRRDNPPSGILSRLSSQPKLSSTAKGTWQRFRDATQTFDTFQQVCSVHAIAIEPDSALSEIFALTNEHGILRDPEKILTGSRIFETLSTHQHTLDELLSENLL